MLELLKRVISRSLDDKAPSVTKEGKIGVDRVFQNYFYIYSCMSFISMHQCRTNKVQKNIDVGFSNLNPNVDYKLRRGRDGFKTGSRSVWDRFVTGGR